MRRTEGFTQYLIAAIFICFGLYQIYLNKIWDFALYSIAGAAFLSIGLIKDKKFQRYQTLLSTLSWILIIAAGLLLIFLVQTD